MELKEDDLVMCTVKRIEGATVFLEVDGNGGEGSMSLSEVAAGRIRNLREYVTPNKKVVCKVLKLINGHPQLSLRRVTAKEREEIEERYNKERTLISLFKATFKNYEEIIAKIRQNEELWKFYDEAREKPEVLEKYLGKEEALRISSLLVEKREKEKEAKKLFILKSYADNGIQEIKEILNVGDEVDIHYLGSSQFSISAKAKEFKEVNSKIDEALEKIAKRSKDKKAVFEIKEK